MEINEQTQARAQAAFDFLSQNPKNHNQQWYISGATDVPLTEENLCGTTMCVAGTVEWQAHGYVTDFAFSAGAMLLGLKYNEAENLFYASNNDEALDMLSAIANGDESKFYALAREATHYNGTAPIDGYGE